MKQVAGNVLKGLGELGKEAGEQLIREAVKIGETVVSGKELLGDIKPLSEAELMKKQDEDEAKKIGEIEKLKSATTFGRNVEAEMEEVRKERERKERETEEKMLEEVRRKREAERQEREQMEASMATNPHKAKKKRGSAFLPGKKQGVTDANQSATAEYFKKPE